MSLDLNNLEEKNMRELFSIMIHKLKYWRLVKLLKFEWFDFVLYPLILVSILSMDLFNQCL